MKAASINEIKKELANHEYKDLLEYCLRLAKFKKENKELLAFLLFEAHDLSAFIIGVKEEIEEQFLEINQSNVYFIKKSVRKILRNLTKKIRISMSAQAEAELLIHFCNCMITYSVPINDSRQLLNLYNNQLKKTAKALSSLHPDLQYDLKRRLVS
jgi:hypothetical protein